ncbi:SDR family oxidoreductase [Conexibacter sp. DBS9H8]|uniref:SDR family oxidoreductase n=1 Tax=Conexibacter sp. DBS9H8 TaxID=2937801 RepID=UPI00200F39C2|nr:SDR family NAD(P)-dependent oxidoreductase [Conexibacter sp. DBS9H8]
MNLDGRVVIITGGASGIGRALVRRCGAEPVGAVVVADLDAEGANTVADELDVPSLGVGVDVSDPAQLDALISEVEARFGVIDIFCANAGIACGTGLESEDAEFRRVLEVNLMAHVHAARRLLPAWLARGEGYFVSTASAAGVLSQIGDVAYTVSKHAAVAFAEWLAITYGDRGVRVSCLCPMGVDTPLGGFAEAGSTEGAWGLAARTVMAAGAILDPAHVAEDVIAAIGAERFLILPHPEVADFIRAKAENPDRWLAGMRRLQARVRADAG